MVVHAPTTHSFRFADVIQSPAGELVNRRTQLGIERNKHGWVQTQPTRSQVQEECSHRIQLDER